MAVSPTGARRPLQLTLVGSQSPSTPTKGPTLSDESKAFLVNVGGEPLAAAVGLLYGMYPQGWAITGSVAVKAHAIARAHPTDNLPPPSDLDIVITDDNLFDALPKRLEEQGKTVQVPEESRTDTPPHFIIEGLKVEIHKAGQGVFPKSLSQGPLQGGQIHFVGLAALLKSKQQAHGALTELAAENSSQFSAPLQRAARHLTFLEALVAAKPEPHPQSHSTAHTPLARSKKPEAGHKRLCVRSLTAAVAGAAGSSRPSLPGASSHGPLPVQPQPPR